VGVGDGGDNLTNVQCKAIWNCHSKSPLYNEYILIKMGDKETKKKIFTILFMFAYY
jgi:hypothetical protein